MVSQKDFISLLPSRKRRLMLSRIAEGSEAPLYEEPLGEYLRGQRVILFPALGVLVMGFILDTQSESLTRRTYPIWHFHSRPLSV